MSAALDWKDKEPLTCFMCDDKLFVFKLFENVIYVKWINVFEYGKGGGNPLRLMKYAAVEIYLQRYVSGAPDMLITMVTYS